MRRAVGVVTLALGARREQFVRHRNASENAGRPLAAASAPVAAKPARLARRSRKRRRRRSGTGGTKATRGWDRADPALRRTTAEAVLLREPSERAAILLGVARRACDVPAVSAQELDDVRALKVGDGTGACLAEGPH